MGSYGSALSGEADGRGERVALFCLELASKEAVGGRDQDERRRGGKEGRREVRLDSEDLISAQWLRYASYTWKDTQQPVVSLPGYITSYLHLNFSSRTIRPPGHHSLIRSN